MRPLDTLFERSRTAVAAARLTSIGKTALANQDASRDQADISTPLRFLRS